MGILSKDEDGNKDKNELKNTLKKTIENIENQMKKLMIHQKKRQKILLSIEEEENAKLSSTSWRGRRGRGGRGGYRGRGRGYRGRGTWRGRGRGRGRGYGYMTMYAPPWMTRRGRGQRGRYKSIVRKTKSVDYRTASLYLTNIPNGIDESELRIHFLKFGEVDTIELYSKQRGIVEFKTRNDAEKALLKGK